MRLTRREPSTRQRPIVQRAVFICKHPHFSEERMLSQELFRPRLFADHRLAKNECPVPGNLRQTANQAIAHVFGRGDLIRLREIGSYWRAKSLRSADVECRITRILVDPPHEGILRQVSSEHWLELPDYVRATLPRTAEPGRIAAE